MERTFHQTLRQRKTLVHNTYLLGFFLALHSYLLIYVNSSFLGSFVSPQAVSVTYIVSSLFALLGFLALPVVERRIGNFKTTLSTIIAELVAVVGLAFAPSFVFAALFFVAHAALVRYLIFEIDVFMEAGSDDEHTGSIRGVLLTVSNVALVLSPLVVGLVLGDTESYARIYLLAGAVLLPTLYFFIAKYRTFKDPEYKHPDLRQTFKRIRNSPDVYRAIITNLILRLFYATMVVYTPLYLHNSIGLPWSTIGTIFTIMLLPFALLEWPLGKLADSRFGEKEFLSIGFIWLALATMGLSFINTAGFLIWATALFVTRIGAATVEIMSETYFFKKIEADDADIISFFRMIQPLAYVFTPLIAGIALFFVDLRYIFLIIGIVVLYGLRYSLTLKDTL